MMPKIKSKIFFPIAVGMFAIIAFGRLVLNFDIEHSFVLALACGLCGAGLYLSLTKNEKDNTGMNMI